MKGWGGVGWGWVGHEGVGWGRGGMGWVGHEGVGVGCCVGVGWGGSKLKLKK